MSMTPGAKTSKLDDSPKAVVAYIALGANLGDREANLREALKQLGETPGLRVDRASSLLENPAVGGPPDSPAFINMVATIQTTLRPEELLDRLLEIERHLGRERREKWGPRPIDLDLLLYGDQIVKSEQLTLPHPRMHERRFVLEPLAEIAPDLVHPVLKRTVTSLLALLPHPSDIGRQGLAALLARRVKRRWFGDAESPGN
ncbi:MAG TPA: 2-amino-4-hydroxy-6-hydroxymethyldihydropteridine diphosphokinase [Humisphaera sp.]|jgi:2-amino-4-hydroxy-6-hydroxymethyldihydropteridine diphosphokinase|nr:2-amino-4-hydroxy-6-hydroxymethyldihydropteridine diphosphokinase [Humisphaera sp.]